VPFGNWGETKRFIFDQRRSARTDSQKVLSGSLNFHTMNSIDRYIFKYLLRRALTRLCPDRIPRSGDAGAAINCYSLRVDHQGEPFVLITSFGDETITGLEWNGASYVSPVTLSLRDVVAADIYTTHYHGLAETNYFGIRDFALGHFTRWPYMKAWLYFKHEGISQFFFNRKKLVTKQRYELLKFMLSRSLEGQTSFESLALMIDLYSIKWVLHPQGEAQHRKVQLYLDLLADAGELKRMNQHTFVLTGQALKAIEEYEEQERRHYSTVKLQRRALYLSSAVALLALVQAGLIRLPPLIDLTKASTQSVPSRNQAP
jgi:hypothetical protein